MAHAIVHGDTSLFRWKLSTLQSLPSSRQRPGRDALFDFCMGSPGPERDLAGSSRKRFPFLMNGSAY
jgi:hypothetical protein